MAFYNLCAKISLCAALLAGSLSVAAVAIPPTTLIVSFHDGRENEFDAGEIIRLECNSGWLIINTLEGATPYKLSTVASLRYIDRSANVGEIKDGEILIRWDGAHLQVLGGRADSHVDVFTIQGVRIASGVCGENGCFSLDCSGFASGIYIVRASDSTLKIVKQ